MDAEQIRLAVITNQRPDINDITGPKSMLVKFIQDCISDCWQENPECRPSFSRTYKEWYKVLCFPISLVKVRLL